MHDLIGCKGAKKHASNDSHLLNWTNCLLPN